MLKREGNVDLYTASSWTPLTRSDMDHTVSPANNTTSAWDWQNSFDIFSPRAYRGSNILKCPREIFLDIGLEISKYLTSARNQGGKGAVPPLNPSAPADLELATLRSCLTILSLTLFCANYMYIGCCAQGQLSLCPLNDTSVSVSPQTS